MQAKCLYIKYILYICSIIVEVDLIMNRIKEILEIKGISQTWLAKQIGKSYCIVNAYACNRRQPNLELMFDIAKALNVDVKELIADNKE